MSNRLSPPAKRGRPGYDRQEVLRVSVEVFNEHGYDATSMDMLAKRLGLTKSAIYHHVSSKEEILKVALDRALDALEEVFEAGESLEADARERLEFVVRQTVFVLAEHLPYVTLLLRLRGNSPVQQAALDKRRALTGRLAALVGAAQEAGQVRQSVDERTLARLIFGMINSLAVWYDPARGKDLDTLADEVVTMAFLGIAQP
ncbi:TetR/AcrR family transcriptional regulator [Rothia nasimurium]|uniref:TetR/AcrR family transcriptional regulator n=1 Tax=Rothia nasimurium TaxID=85336 RepID=UPI001F2D606D|nr:TetR/AcrR family transcriptional regulator [Rothia nasimurium]